MKVGRSQDNPAATPKVIREGAGSRSLQKSDTSASPQVRVPVPLSVEHTEGLTLRGSRSEISETIRTLIRMLNSGSPRQMALLPLLQLARELPAGKDGTPVDSRDSRILQYVLREWRNRYGGELSPKIRSRLEFLENQLGQSGEEGLYLLSEEPAPEFSRPRFSVEERQKCSAGKPEEPQLILDMELPELGRVRSTFSGGDKGIGCRIACESVMTRRRLKKALPRLRERLGSFRIKELLLRRLRKSEVQQSLTAESKKRGIHLWG